MLAGPSAIPSLPQARSPSWLQEPPMSNVRRLFIRSRETARVTIQWTKQIARLMVGIPDYEVYVEHRRETHPGEPIMTYEQFFIERRDARYAVGKGRFRGCC